MGRWHRASSPLQAMFPRLNFSTPCLLRPEGCNAVNIGSTCVCRSQNADARLFRCRLQFQRPDKRLSMPLGPSRQETREGARHCPAWPRPNGEIPRMSSPHGQADHLSLFCSPLRSLHVLLRRTVHHYIVPQYLQLVFHVHRRACNASSPCQPDNG